MALNEAPHHFAALLSIVGNVYSDINRWKPCSRTIAIEVDNSEAFDLVFHHLQIENRYRPSKGRQCIPDVVIYVHVENLVVMLAIDFSGKRIFIMNSTTREMINHFPRRTIHYEKPSSVSSIYDGGISIEYSAGAGYVASMVDKKLKCTTTLPLYMLPL